MHESQPAASRRRTIGIIAAAGLACLAIAVPVSGAFGADENGTADSAAQQQGGYGQQGYGAPPGAQGQGQPPGDGQGRPDGDCPKGQDGQGQSQEGSGTDSSGSALPGDSVQL